MAHVDKNKEIVKYINMALEPTKMLHACQIVSGDFLIG